MSDEREIRESILKAAERLVREKLVSRTWGNISARLSDEEFIITPSGRAYDGMKPEDLVKVRISDLSYDEKGFKPSSEKGIHAAVYARRPDANFVIHTHQLYATAVCAAEKDAAGIPCAEYALSGSDELCESVKACMTRCPDARAFLLAKHGTLCFGKDALDAFDETEKLEEKCKALFDERISPEEVAVAGERYEGLLPAYIDDYAQIFPAQEGEDPEALSLIRYKNILAMLYAKDAGPLSPENTEYQHRKYVDSYSKLIK